MVSDDANDGAKVAREISKVAFPYYDLDDSIEIARAMHAAGGVPLDRDQLGAALNLSPSGGNFAVKVSAARMFGLIDNVGGRFQLTELGFEILDPARERSAKAQAFLKVELYRKVYDSFKGRQLPPRPVGLEQAFVQFGVASKQRDKARHTFDRSARTAGFFPTSAEDRLVQPVIIGGGSGDDSVRRDESNVAPVQNPVVVSAPVAVLHPFIQGLLETLPEAKTEWATGDRAKWLQAAAQIFDLIYTGGGGPILVEVKGQP
ncbi:hypothetical protein [Caulobacter soli]|uniref:hypothetical protein n=1 Tax=Caulobacter soli TaxID=2708539 RepID=UPI0013ECD38E|nr:hypothetical protein [Caulobacter soli]